MNDGSMTDVQVVTGISSMATRFLLEDIASDGERKLGQAVRLESVGGRDAARRIAEGEPFDFAVLAEDAIAQLVTAGHLMAGSEVVVARSCMAAAVPANAAPADIRSAESLRQLARTAARIGYSTGPSGKHVLQLMARWAMSSSDGPELVQAPPGVPVATLIARGEVDLGFQQLSELMHAPDIQVLGPLPREIELVTTFSAACCRRSRDSLATRRLLDFLASPATLAARRRHGLDG